MAYTEHTAFPLFLNIPDDSRLVHQAMFRLGFICEFADLTTEQMRVTLTMAAFLKSTQEQSETWES